MQGKGCCLHRPAGEEMRGSMHVQRLGPFAVAGLWREGVLSAAAVLAGFSMSPSIDQE
jgi:hypothetical protein